MVNWGRGCVGFACSILIVSVSLKLCWNKKFCCSVVCSSLWPHGLQHASLPVPHHLLEFAQIHVRWIGNAIQPSHPLSFSSPYKHLIMTHISIIALPPLHSYFCTTSLWVETGIFKVFHQLANSNTFMSHSYDYKLHTHTHPILLTLHWNTTGLCPCSPFLVTLTLLIISSTHIFKCHLLVNNKWSLKNKNTLAFNQQGPMISLPLTEIHILS